MNLLSGFNLCNLLVNGVQSFSEVVLLGSIGMAVSKSVVQVDFLEDCELLGVGEGFREVNSVGRLISQVTNREALS